ncbi:MAG: ABC transporter ATP-binding protein [Elusimicrobia bacterium]|nr:ABC transporter ATP-binding protein [Elusimicrobiota bacterium]
MNAVEVSGLTIRFGDFTAVDHISFSVDRGEIFGFLGANGAGKTTTIRMLCGLLVPSEGRVRVAGLGFEDGGRAIKSKVGYMSQRFTLYNDLSVGENIRFAGALRKLDDDALVRRTREILDFAGYRGSLEAAVSSLPGGIKQQLALAVAILHDPEIIFLDEPTAGVAPAARERFWSLIRELSKAGKTVFVTTHYMDEAENCGRIALMRAGRIIALDTPDGLKQATFPEPLFELDPAGRDSSWLGLFEEQPAAVSVQPYGTRYHAAVSDPAAWERLRRRLPATVKVRAIRPSLEDVFIRLVEGTER